MELERNNMQLDNSKKPNLRALKVDVEKDGVREVLHVEPIAHNVGDRIVPATSVDESLTTFDIPVGDYRVEDTTRLQEMGLSTEKIRAHQNAVNNRVTDRAIAEKGRKAKAQQDGPSIGE